METTLPVAVLIEDERQIRRFVRAALEAVGLRVWEAASCREGLLEVGSRQPDLIVLDLGLPDGDGVELVGELRGWCQTPILILSARTDEAQKVAALDRGADDYLTKPFGIPEMQARVRALMRRRFLANGQENPIFECGSLRVDLAHRVVTRVGEEVHLTPKEYKMLVTLISHAGKVLTHRQLLKEVWGPSCVERVQYLRVFMVGLRRKIEDNPACPRHLLTESGVGYRLVTG